MIFHIKLHDIFEILRVSLVGNPLKPLSIISKRPLKLRFSSYSNTKKFRRKKNILSSNHKWGGLSLGSDVPIRFA